MQTIRKSFYVGQISDFNNLQAWFFRHGDLSTQEPTREFYIANNAPTQNYFKSLQFGWLLFEYDGVPDDFIGTILLVDIGDTQEKALASIDVSPCFALGQAIPMGEMHGEG